MIKNYFKIAFRNLWRDKAFSFINILGLSLGMICVILILFYIMDELSYDKHFKDSDRIHRIAIAIENANKTKLTTAPVTGMLPQALVEYPQVEEVTRLIGNFARKTLVSVNADKQFYEDQFYWVDPNLYKVFNYKFLRGNPATALEAPLNMVITREMAEKYFGTIDALGKTLKTPGKEYQITGVVENLPSNSHFKLDFMASMLGFPNPDAEKNWHATMFHTYVKLKPNSDAKQFETQIHDIAYKYVGEEIKNNGQAYRFFLQPLTSIHLHSHLEFELGKNNSYRQLQVLGVVAVIILLIACFNFINIATARATRRAKEVGIRKTVGSGRWQLVGQFFIESLLMSTFSLLIALVGVELLLPIFNQIADKELSFRFLAQPLLLLIFITVFLIITLLAGSYPALVLSKFQPQEVLKGSSSAVVVGNACAIG
ncbi:MAG: ABC transporter permease [Saprospiraceae bacterium]|nr:ABC transporter permease [Saprospiraceae bacterium]